MYLKYIYFMLSMLQIHFYIYVLNKMSWNCTFSALNSILNVCYIRTTNFVLNTLEFYGSSAEVQLKIYLVYLIVLKWNYCKYTPGTL